MNITFLGNTGAGKTTFIKELMKKYPKGNLCENKYGMLDDSYSHEYMKKFCQNPMAWAYENEMIFLLNTIKNISVDANNINTDHILLDRSFLDVYTFIEGMKKLYILENDEYHKLRKHIDVIMDLYIKDIDLIVYLQSDFTLLQKNVATRARHVEKLKYMPDYTELFIKLALQINEELGDLIYDKLKPNYNIKIIRFKNISSHDIKSDEYQKALDAVNFLADHM